MSEKLSILIVEDESILAIVLEKMLTRLGCGVCARVASGEEALLEYENKKPDLILFDIRLRGTMTGLEAARAVRAKSATAKFAFMTAYGTEDIRDEAMDLAPLAFFEKPLLEGMLASLVNPLKRPL